jgi:hypothetical protein
MSNGQIRLIGGVKDESAMEAIIHGKDPWIVTEIGSNVRCSEIVEYRVEPDAD